MMACSGGVVDVAYCCDRMMLPGLFAAMGSLLTHVSRPARLWISLHGVSEGPRRRVEGFLAAHPRVAGVTFLDIDLQPYGHFRGLHGNRTIYARIELARHVGAERLLYLDSDTLCLADVAPLFDLDLQGHVCAMASFGLLDGFLETTVRERLALPPSLPCFNSGVILMDTAAWRAAGISRRVQDLEAAAPGEVRTGDQGFLNAVMHSEIAGLDGCWNVALCPSTPVSARTGARIAHFVGLPKPWDPVGCLIHTHSRVFLCSVWSAGALDVLVRHWLLPATWQSSHRHRGAHRQRLREWAGRKEGA